MNNIIQCSRCEYEWTFRVQQPKDYSECEARLNKQIVLEVN